MQGVVLLSGHQLYMWYVEVLIKTYNAGDRTFYDAITFDSEEWEQQAAPSQASQLLLSSL